MERRSNSFAFFTASGRILAMLAGFLMPLFLTRFLTQENYGLYSQFNVLLGFMSSMFSFGMQSNLYYYFPGSDIEKKKRLVGNTYFSLIVLALLAMTLLLIPQTQQWFIGRGKLLEFSKLVAIGIFFSVPVLLIHPLFVIKGDKKLSVIYPPAEALLRILIIVATSLVFKTIESILIAMVLYHIMQFIFVTIYSSWPYRKVHSSWFEWRLLKTQFVYAAPFGFAVILNTVLGRFDKMLCISYISPEEYAIYSLAFYGIPGITQIYSSVGEVNILNMSAAYKENDIKGVITLAQDYVVRLISFSVPIILVAFLYASIVIDFLFPPNYIASVPFFRIYILSFLVGAFGAGLVLRATGKTKYTLKAYLVSAVIYLPFAFFSIKYYGTWGAITTAMLGIILPKLFQIAFEIKILQVSIWKYMPWSKIAKIIAISVVPLIPLVVLSFFVTLNVFVAGALAIVYVLAVYYFELKKSLFIVSKQTITTYVSKIMNTIPIWR